MLNDFFIENIVFVPWVAFLMAVILKWFFLKLKEWKIDLRKALWSWWMPSVHSAVVTSLTTIVWLKYWVVQSDLFAICIWFTVIIIYDAINIRFQAWLHASAINKLIWENFKEHLWHLPSEAFAWSLVWIFTAIILYNI